MATPGQNVSSNRKKTLRRAMMMFRCANAHVRTHSPWAASASELNEHLLELRLPHLTISNATALLDQPSHNVRQALVGGVDGALDTLTADGHREHAGQLSQPLGHRGLQAQRDHVADPDLALQAVRASPRQDSAALDEGDLVAELFRLAHVVRREDDRGAL